MGDSLFNTLDKLKHQQAAQNRRQYSLTQPQSNLQYPPVPARDRYRAPLYCDEVYDMLGDGEPYEEGIHLDSFDHELLEQPYDERISKGTKGHGRLSLLPKASKFFIASSQARSSFHERQTRPSNDVQPESDQQPLQNFSQFVYNTTQPHESSSDPDFGVSSSPTLKAGQRRAESDQVAAPRHATQSRYPQHTYPIPSTPRQQRSTQSSFQPAQKSAPNRLGPPHVPSAIQGIPPVSIKDLPNQIRAVFPFPAFNAVQSKCFDRVYKSDDNFVLASPTGSGKTAILELSICRAVANIAAGQYKIVYQAPIKALCSERARDWQKKFTPLGLNCVELTGDTDSANLGHVQSADIIITTPEKWDSITRKWKDHEKLMRLIKLFLIDEVHVLNNDRGAILEAVVSRMKTIGTDVRFVALSATVPNLEDVAAWLGKNAVAPYEPANSEKFGEEFRPVKLKKHVCGYLGSPNEFQFDNYLDSKLPDVISKYSERKPIMVFCFTRSSTISTAKMLASLWSSSTGQKRYWKKPSKPLNVQNQELRSLLACGVAFHHAGLDTNDRLEVEKGFLMGDVNVICCTSTLAVGVNLPCHFVIIKNTVSWSNTGSQEYSDLEIMQMIGRAGRPQFDDSAVAVILTRQAKVLRYETMVTGQEILESRLHLGFIEHLNAEVSLRTIRDLTSARKWLSGTFLHVRLKQNPAHYRLEGARSGQALEEQLDDICLRDLTLLRESGLLEGKENFRCTPFGEAMARYYVKFKTMQIIVDLQPNAQISEILSALSQAAEFTEIRFRAGEKSLYKNLNQSPSIRFPIPVTLNHTAHKVSLLIQSVLGASDILWDKETGKHKSQYGIDVAVVFRHVRRLICCIIDCLISLGDSIAIQHALLVQRSVCAQAWDDSPLQMRQIQDIGVVAVRKLVNADIRSIEELEYAESQRIEMVLGRNPPFGLKLLERLKSFPKLRVSIQVSPSAPRRTADGVKIQLKVDIGFLNETPPQSWQSKFVNVCFLVETSDGRMVHFARISGQKLGNGQELLVSALLTCADQSVNCFVMCDEIAGTMREATVKPKIAPSWFTAPKPPEPTPVLSRMKRPTSNMSKRRVEELRKPSRAGDEFDDGLEDDDLVQASFADLDFDHIENYASPTRELTRKNTAKNTAKNTTKNESAQGLGQTKSVEEESAKPRQLDNGKWACNHICKDKTACKHMCCRGGLDKPPKKSAKNAAPVSGDVSQINTSKRPEHSKRKNTQTKLQLTASKRKSSTDIETLDLTQQEKRRKTEFAMKGPTDNRNLHQLHKNVQKKDPPASIAAVMRKQPKYCYAAGGEHNLSFLERASTAERQVTATSDYGDLQLEEVSSPFGETKSSRPFQKDIGHQGRRKCHDMKDAADDLSSEHHSDAFSDDDSLLGEAMIGVIDSQDIRAAQSNDDEDLCTLKDLFDLGEESLNCIDPLNLATKNHVVPELHESSSPSPVQVLAPVHKPKDSDFFNKTRDHDAGYDGFKPARSMLKGPALQEMKQGNIPASKELTEFNNGETATQPNENQSVEVLETIAVGEVKNDKENIPDAYKDLEPWLYAEFGDIIELVDN